MLSAGFDAHAEDPLAGLQLADADYSWVTAELLGLAAECGNGRVVSVMEGGYDLPALRRCVADHVELLAAAR